MSANGVVEHFDVAEDIAVRLLPRRIGFSADALPLKQLKEAFSNCVVVTVSPFRRFTCSCQGLARGAIHVIASGPGWAFCQTVLDMDQLVDLRVRILETAASVAEIPSPTGWANQVQPALGQETERSPGAALEVQNPEETEAPPSTLKAKGLNLGPPG